MSPDPSSAQAARSSGADAAPPPGPEASAAAEGLAVGAPAPRFMLPVVYGSTERRFGPAHWVGPSAKSPRKLVLLSFFASYCEPCKKELPELARLEQAYRAQGLGVLLVSIDKGQEPLAEVVSLAQASGVQFPVVHDRFQLVARRYAAERLPYLLMVGADGAVRQVHIGYTEEARAQLDAEVRDLLGLPAHPKSMPPAAASAADSPAAVGAKGKPPKTRNKRKKSWRRRRPKPRSDG